MSSRFLDLPQPKEAGFPLYRMPVEVRASLDEKGRLVLQAGESEPFSALVSIDIAQRKRPFVGILSDLLAESGGFLFTPSRVLFDNGSGLADDEIFVPPSRMKKVKIDFYAALDADFLARIEARTDPPRRLPPPGAGLSSRETALPSERQKISPPACAPVPFVDADPSRLDVPRLAKLAGRLWLPLPPVILDETEWLGRLRDAGREAAQLGKGLAVGLNNLSHLAFAHALRDEENVRFFVDVYLYAANSRTLAVARERVRDLLFAYAWIEGSAEDAQILGDASNGLPVLRIDEGFRPPLFYSLGCFARHVLNGGRCFDECPKDFTRDLRQGKNSFRAVVRDCVTWLFADPRQ